MQYYLISTLLAFYYLTSNPTSFEVEKLGQPPINIFHSQEQYKLKGYNLALLYQYIFKSAKLTLLIKCYVQGVVAFESDNHVLF